MILFGWRARGVLLAALTIGCQALMFPPVSLPALAWVAPLPFFLAFPAPRRRDAAAFGWIVGSGTLLAVVAPWLWPALREVLPTSSLTRAALLAVVVQVVGALPFTALALVADATTVLGPASRMLLLPAAWAAVEYLRAHVLFGTTWGLLGAALAGSPTTIQVADLGGVYAISFVAVLPAAAARHVCTRPPR